MTSPLGKDMIFLIMQYLDEEKLKDVLHKLEQESGLYFNMKHFEDLVLAGNWTETEKYFSSFTKVEDNRYSMKIYFELRKQKYLEALDNNERGKAVNILYRDLKVFAAFNEELFKDLTQLLTLDNIRQNEQLAGYRDARSSRATMLIELKRLIESNPAFRDKLQFPTIRSARLRMLINQSLNWQHGLCPNPRQNPDIKTLFVDHSCRNANDHPSSSANNQFVLGSTSLQPRPDGTFLALGGTNNMNPFAVPIPLSGWALPSPVFIPNSLTPSPSTSTLNVLPNSAAVSKARPLGASDKTQLVCNSQSKAIPMAEEFPTSVVRILTQGLDPMSMDFHPIQPTLLLVGTNVGEISLWEVFSVEKLASRTFQIGLVKDQFISVKKILWTAEGNMFGVAFSKNVVQIYRYHGGSDIRKYLEFEAHAGSVNDLAFTNLTKTLCVITCGDDKLIKVWDVGTGSMLYYFEGHSSPVSSVCPQARENDNYLFSTSEDGKVKAWLYDLGGTRANYEAPSRSCTALAYTSDGKRLFTCGTNKEGESHIVEWNEADGTVKRAYQGFRKNSSASGVQFGITKNRFLAVGDDHSIKVWDIDNVNLLGIVDADGDLPANPRIRFNKDGSLLAVSTNDNKIKILANADGLRLIRAYENRSLFPPRPVPETAIAQNNKGVVRKPDEVNPNPAEEAATITLKLPEITEPNQIRSLRLPASEKVQKISRLVFANSGMHIVALASNGVHLIWKWGRSEQNTSGKATTKIAPQLALPASANAMINDLKPNGKAVDDDGLCCIAFSKNDSYLISASGGKISVFNMASSKTMATFMAPPPVATCLAFHPQDNNVVAVGMDDSTIHIYNVRNDRVLNKLRGQHSKRITGLAFSNALKILVSSGADSQIVAWNWENWKTQKSNYLAIPGVKTEAAMLSDTQVQFHVDQTHILVVHQVQLSIHDATKLVCTKQWVTEDSWAPISQATFSSDSQLVYAVFFDGMICVFGATDLQPLCRIKRSAYLPAIVNMTSGSETVAMPKVVVAHPQEAKMVAVGLSDGGVVLLEPLESEIKWGAPPPLPALPLPAPAAPAPTQPPVAVTAASENNGVAAPPQPAVAAASEPHLMTVD